MVNIKQLSGHEKLPALSRNWPQAGSVSELLGAFFSRDCNAMFCYVMICNLQLFIDYLVLIVTSYRSMFKRKSFHFA